MRLLTVFCFFLMIFLSLTFSPISFSKDSDSKDANMAVADTQWHPYPQDLPQMDFSGGTLKQQWPTLAMATKLPFPDAAFIESMLKHNPKLAEQQLVAAQKPAAHPTLKTFLVNDYQALALLVQDVWRLHFQGQYQQAYRMGMSLGPVGLGPALYAKLIYTTHLIEDPEEKERLFLEVDQQFSHTLPLTVTDDFLLFGDSYQKRIIST